MSYLLLLNFTQLLSVHFRAHYFVGFCFCQEQVLSWLSSYFVTDLPTFCAPQDSIGAGPVVGVHVERGIGVGSTPQHHRIPRPNLWWKEFVEVLLQVYL